jgi:hypothetical protein
MFSAAAHVPGTAASLAGATVTFCRNGACAAGTFGAASDAGTVASTSLSGAPFTASAEITFEADGFTAVGITLDVSRLSLADGDTYRVQIADASGKALLDVSRPVTYDVVQSCGPTCHDYTMDVYPTSASGIACGDKECTSGALFKGTLTTTDSRDPVLVTLCRNGTCGTSGPVALAADPSEEAPQGNLTGGLAGSWGIQSAKGTTFDFQVSTSDDAAALGDGDTYTLTITQNGATLASWSGVAPYQTTFPNGMQCDAFPCRHATVSVD